ncbi:MAG: DNA cytosine methyltransferase [Bradyrhizobium sp.]
MYNENAPFAADWLEDLIIHDLIAPGTVDRRSVADLSPEDVAGTGQRHFFAGIGGWSHALRIAGVRDDAPIWTGSCPCQGLSDAGQRRGFLDPRHLWPAWFALIEICRPPIIFGEQVASRLGLVWLDLVFADLERCGYTVGAADLCAAGVGAPHQRQRLYFVAHTDGVPRGLLLRHGRSRGDDAQAERRSQAGLLADSDSPGLEVRGEQQARGQRTAAERGGAAGELANGKSQRRRQGRRATGSDRPGPANNSTSRGMGDTAGERDSGRTSGIRCFWRVGQRRWHRTDNTANCKTGTARRTRRCSERPCR